MNPHCLMNFSFSGRPRNPWTTPKLLEVSFFTTESHGTTCSSSCIRLLSRLEFRESVPSWPTRGPLSSLRRGPGAQVLRWPEANPMHDSVAFHAIFAKRRRRSP